MARLIRPTGGWGAPDYIFVPRPIRPTGGWGFAGLHLRGSAHPAYGWLGIRRITFSCLGSSGLRVVGDSPDYIFVPRLIRPTSGWGGRRITPRASAHPAYGWLGGAGLHLRASAHQAYGWLGIRRITSSYLGSSGLRVVGGRRITSSCLGPSGLRVVGDSPDNASCLDLSGLRVVGDSPDYIFVPRPIWPTGSVFLMDSYIT
ncbi:hypothetical protein DFP80_107246 [Marinomonas rhizomae]|uniref:Uncharacterized protein n=1 Tax=Marinomonas rhizomae TaxID=491948 RepID=A0A366J8Q8_9GAMM|nr:hypothetical protein DFP80_107246 [Marinomonas rhizomae]